MIGQFSVQAWAGFAPGLESPEAWRAWASEPGLPTGEAMPALAEMPAMQRRRLEKLGRMALQVAWHCQPEGTGDMPLVFASRHGDIGRTFEMLAVLARGEALSPTQFGLSTHNAIAAQYSITRVLAGNYLAVSAGANSAAAALVEALALLADGAPAVLVVVYDNTTPEAYAAYRDEPEAPYAWAWRVGPPCEGHPRFSIEAGAGLATGTGALPHGLDVLRFFLAGDAGLVSPDGAWQWRRHG